MTTSGTRWLTAAEQATWRAYLEMHRLLMARLNRDITEAAGLSLADFAVLVQLSEHENGRMRVLEIARAIGWEKSRVSHQLTRMQQRGLVSRTTCSEDRRGAVVVLTDDGRRTVEAAAPIHVESVRRYLFDALDAGESAALGSISARVAVGIGDACAGLPPDEPCG